MNKTTKKLLLLTASLGLIASTTYPILNASANDVYVDYPGAPTPGPALMTPIVSYDMTLLTTTPGDTDFCYNIFNNHLTTFEAGSYLYTYQDTGEVSPHSMFYWLEIEKELIPSNSDYYPILQKNYNSYNFEYGELYSIIFSFNNTFLDIRTFTDNDIPFINLGFNNPSYSVNYSYSLNLEYTYLNADNLLTTAVYSFGGIASTGIDLGINFELLEIGNTPLINITGGTFVINLDSPYYPEYEEFFSIHFNTYMTYKDAGIKPSTFYSTLQFPPAFEGLGTFLTDSIGGFLDFEIFPGLSLSTIGLVFIGLGMLFAILKIFFGG